MENRIRIAIVDDEKTSLDIILDIAKNAFAAKNISSDIDCFSSSAPLFSSLKEKRYDIVFRDIELKAEDGIEVAGRISKRYPDTILIYISSHEDRVFDSLKTHPFGFIRKGCFMKDFDFRIDSYLGRNEEIGEEKKLILKGKTTRAIPIGKITYIESQGKYQFIHIDGSKDKIQVRKNRNDFQSELQEYGFIRIHKGYLVNSAFIKIINDEDVILNDSTRLDLSKRKVKEIRERYLLVLKNKKQSIVRNGK